MAAEAQWGMLTFAAAAAVVLQHSLGFSFLDARPAHHVGLSQQLQR
jgi:hypothetical protein